MARHSRMSQRARRPQIHKFGGASLADATAVRHAVALIVSHRAEPTVVVLSAMAGVTDALLDIAKRAVVGDVAGALRESARLRARHVDVARAVLRGASQRVCSFYFNTSLLYSERGLPGVDGLFFQAPHASEQ